MDDTRRKLWAETFAETHVCPCCDDCMEPVSEEARVFRCASRNCNTEVHILDKGLKVVTYSPSTAVTQEVWFSEDVPVPSNK